MKNIISKWRIGIRSGKEEILQKEVKRGILQDDSLSPLLFVLCMDPLSRKLNAMYQKDSAMYTTNYLIFIDDLKLLAESELQRMMKETKEFFETLGIEMNKDKSASTQKQ